MQEGGKRISLFVVNHCALHYSGASSGAMRLSGAFCMATSELKPILDAGSFRRGQWRILLLVMFCYLFFYTGRQNFGFAARGMQEELHLSSTAIGLFNAMLLLGYGVGQAINGNLADMYGARRMVAIGAFASVALNWCVSLSQSFLVAVAAWGVNGLAQSTAWPAMNRALANWWPKNERGKAIGL